MNEWIYRNSMAEYEQRPETIDNERRARKLSAQRPTRAVVSAVIAGLTKRFDAHSQPENRTAVRLQPRG